MKFACFASALLAFVLKYQAAAIALAETDPTQRLDQEAAEEFQGYEMGQVSSRSIIADDFLGLSDSDLLKLINDPFKVPCPGGSCPAATVGASPSSTPALSPVGSPVVSPAGGDSEFMKNT